MKVKRNKIYTSGLFIKKSLVRLDLGVYWFWAGLRIFLTLVPQTGYIHPDEYFQSVEVFAGILKIFKQSLFPKFKSYKTLTIIFFLR